MILALVSYNTFALLRIFTCSSITTLPSSVSGYLKTLYCLSAIDTPLPSPTATALSFYIIFVQCLLKCTILDVLVVLLSSWGKLAFLSTHCHATREDAWLHLDLKSLPGLLVFWNKIMWPQLFPSPFFPDLVLVVPSTESWTLTSVCWQRHATKCHSCLSYLATFVKQTSFHI